MKKWICLIAVLAMLFSLAACSAKTDGAEKDAAPSDSAAPAAPSDAASAGVEDGQNPVMNFVGNYAMDRATILVEADGAENAKITVRWSGSAWEHAEWVMTGKLDTETLVVDYKDCVKTLCTYSESGELKSEDVEYENGTGSFTFHTDGDAITLTWDDAMEQIADGMEFEYVGVVPAG